MLVALCLLLAKSNTLAKLKKDKAKDNNVIIGKSKVCIIQKKMLKMNCPDHSCVATVF